MEIRTRFAPSPTGFMHIGNLRTALFSYLTAKSQNGKFILRIEDTDRNRLVEGSVETIYRTLKNTGIIPDESPENPGAAGPYIQSERKEIYIRYAEELIKSGKAYRCFCEDTKTDTEKAKDEYGGGMNENGKIGYNGHCRNLSEEEIEKNLKEGRPFVIRQKMPYNSDITFHDAVFGEITINSDELDDQVLIKRDGYPTYNFANVIDDHLMEITHVVRGSEYLPSTPKYNLLYDAFGWDPPEYVHLPLINGKDSEGNISKLSKRHGSVSFEDLVDEGYLPEAILNYIAFLGWNPKTDRELFTLDELEHEFSIKNINKSPAVFDYEKLSWMNAQYMKNMPLEKFRETGINFISSEAIKKNWDTVSELIHEKTENFKDIEKMFEFLTDPGDYDINIFINKKNKVELISVNPCLVYLLSKITPESSREDYEHILHEYAEMKNVKFGHPMWIFRVALSGRQNTCIGGYEIADLLGSDEVILRLKLAEKKVNNNSL